MAVELCSRMNCENTAAYDQVGGQDRLCEDCAAEFRQQFGAAGASQPLSHLRRALRKFLLTEPPATAGTRVTLEQFLTGDC